MPAMRAYDLSIAIAIVMPRITLYSGRIVLNDYYRVTMSWGATGEPRYS